MKKCPKCDKWTLEFDEYFGRFRCFNGDCGWMAMSSAELEIRSLRSGRKPDVLVKKEIPELGLTFTSAYDAENDALLFDFGLDEPTFDLPEGDGRMIWKIGRDSGSVAGFTILLAKRFAISEVAIKLAGRKETIERVLAARKETIERVLERLLGAASSGRVTRVLIDAVEVTARSTKVESRAPQPKMMEAIGEGVAAFTSRYVPAALQNGEYAPA
jgi:hypothetical protein